MSILDNSKILMYEFWYDYIKPKHGDRAELWCTDNDNLMLHITTEDFYKDIADDVEKWFDTSNYGENDERPRRNQYERIKKYQVFLKMN